MRLRSLPRCRAGPPARGALGGGGGAGVVLAGDRLEERLPVGPLAIAATYEPGLRLAREGCRGEVPRATRTSPPRESR